MDSDYVLLLAFLGILICHSTIVKSQSGSGGSSSQSLGSQSQSGSDGSSSQSLGSQIQSGSGGSSSQSLGSQSQSGSDGSSSQSLGSQSQSGSDGSSSQSLGSQSQSGSDGSSSQSLGSQSQSGSGGSSSQSLGSQIQSGSDGSSSQSLGSQSQSGSGGSSSQSLGSQIQSGSDGSSSQSLGSQSQSGSGGSSSQALGSRSQSEPNWTFGRAFTLGNTSSRSLTGTDGIKFFGRSTYAQGSPVAVGSNAKAAGLQNQLGSNMVTENSEYYKYENNSDGSKPSKNGWIFGISTFRESPNGGSRVTLVSGSSVGSLVDSQQSNGSSSQVANSSASSVDAAPSSETSSQVGSSSGSSLNVQQSSGASSQVRGSQMQLNDPRGSFSGQALNAQSSSESSGTSSQASGSQRLTNGYGVSVQSLNVQSSAGHDRASSGVQVNSGSGIVSSQALSAVASTGHQGSSSQAFGDQFSSSRENWSQSAFAISLSLLFSQLSSQHRIATRLFSPNMFNETELRYLVTGGPFCFSRLLCECGANPASCGEFASLCHSYFRSFDNAYPPEIASYAEAYYEGENSKTMTYCVALYPNCTRSSQDLRSVVQKIRI